MAQHGYLGEGYGMWGDRDADEEGRERNRGGDWRKDRDRGLMFEGRDRWRERGERSDAGEWFGGRERSEDRSAWEGNRDWPQRERGMSHYGREHGYGGFQGDYSSGREQGGFGGRGDYERGRRSFSSNPDDHYRSWRDRQVQALDRDYADYCHEREQQFHQDFDTWRRQRQANPQPLQTGMTQSGLSADPTGTTQAEGATAVAEPSEQDPMATATLGTTSGGRARR